MKFIIYSFMTMLIMLNIMCINSVPLDPPAVLLCFRNIQVNLQCIDKETCFKNFLYYHEQVKPPLPIIKSAFQQPDLDTTLINRLGAYNAEWWVMFAFYLGERNIVGEVLKPTPFCYTKYLNYDLLADMDSNGDFVYPRNYQNRITNTSHMKDEKIIYTQTMMEKEKPSQTVITNRNNCIDRLKLYGLIDDMSIQDLFVVLYRISGIHDVDNKTAIGLYFKHFYKKSILMIGTLDALPFCRKCSVFAALNDDSTTNVSLNDDNTLNNNFNYDIATLDLINNIGDQGESSSRRDHSGSSPKLLNLFPTNNVDDDKF